MKLTARQNKIIEDISSASIRSVRKIAEALSELRSTFSDEDGWTGFCQSGTLGYGERTITDYVTANAWLQETEVEDTVLGKLSVRSMAWMALLKEADAERFTELEARLLVGEVLTQGDIRPAKEREDKPSWKVLATQFKSDADKLGREVVFWKERLHYLERIQGVELTEYPEAEQDDAVSDADALWKSVTVSNRKKTVRKTAVAV